MKLISRRVLILVFFTIRAFAQDSTLVISQPVDVSNEGINRLLQLSNGNTALLHFENKRHMRVKLFDKTGKEIASAVPELKIVDMAMIEKAKLESLFEADGDIVLYFDQAANLSNVLIKVILDGRTGRLKKEEIAAELDKYGTHVFYNKRGNGYTVLLYRNSSAEDSVKIIAKRYDYNNNLVEELKYEQKKAKDYFYFPHSSADYDGNILIGLLSNSRNSNSISDMQLLYLRNDMHAFVTRTFTLPEGYGLNKILFTRNAFAGNLNIMMLSGKGLIFDVNEQSGYWIQKEYSWLIMSENMSDVKSINFSVAAKQDLVENDNSVYNLADFYTNDNGITTVLHVEGAPSNKLRGSNWEYIKRMIVSKYDDNGMQIGNSVDIACRHAYAFDGSHGVLSDLNDKRTLHMSKSFITQKSIFVIMNDVPANQEVKEQSAVTEVVDFNTSEAVICQVNKKNVYTRKYFFNTVDSGEHKQVLPATLDYNEKTKIVSAVMRKKKGKQETFHVAWRRLED